MPLPGENLRAQAMPTPTAILGMTIGNQAHLSTYLPQTPFKTPFIAHMCPWWGFFKTDQRKNLVWFTSELKQYVENQNWVVATPLRGDLKRYGEGKSLTGRAVCSTLCGPPCTERKGT